MSQAPAISPSNSRPKSDHPAVEFRVLGPLAVIRGGRSIPLGGSKQRLILTLLVLEANRVVSADRLIDQVWGDTPTEAARGTLQAYVSRLRKVLGPVKIEARAPGYVLEVSPAHVDASEFENLVEIAKQLSPEKKATQLAKALALWRGPAYAEFSSQPFALSEATRLNELRIHALEERIEAELALGRHAQLIGELESLVTANPLRERLCAQLMLALYRSGRQAEASAVYQRTRLQLVEELGMEPGPDLQSLLTRILKQDPGLELLSDSLTRRRNELPVQLTSFVGREAELEEVLALLRRSRLVTLVGPGGVGKTRLAIEAARLMRDRELSIESVIFVDLAPLQTTELLEQTLVTALGGRREGAPPSVETIVALLGSAQPLLLIDNCEHLVDAVARLVDQLLRSHPGVSILATSREPLRVASEARWFVLPLNDMDSVRLFVDRAQLIDTKFGQSEGVESIVVRLCRSLDCIPLAIELAAARIGQMPVGEILARLDDRFVLLTESDRTAPARHHNLRVALDWSYQLLDDREKDVFASLSVFAGGFDATAAQAVTGCSFDEIGRLVEKSMVVRGEAGSDGRARYRLLETLRQYASPHLSETGHALDTGERHFSYFAGLAAKAAPELRGPNELLWLQRLTENLGNLRTALEWALSENPDQGLAMAVALEWLWQFQGPAEGRWWLQRLASAARSPSPETMAAATRLAGDLAHQIGERDAAQTEIARALDLWRRLDDPGQISRTLVNLAQVAGRTTADLAARRSLLDEALTQARRSGDDVLIMEALSFLGMALSYAGKSDEGRTRQLEAEVLARRNGHLWSVAYIIWRDARAYLWEGNLDHARERCEEGLKMLSSSGDARTPAIPIVVLGCISLAENDLTAARLHFQRVLAMDWITIPPPVAIEGLAVLAARSRNYARALKLGGAASSMQWVLVRLELPRQELQRSIDSARRNLDPQTADAAWRAGVEMTMPRLRAYALSEEDEIVATADR
jgi:predicted ATPase/DNA-binding SARP family transcriptional activator